MVTDRIVEELAKGIIPWHKPWAGGTMPAISYVTRKPYSLLNQFLLGRPGEYLTFNQVKSLGGSVKKGAKSKFVVFFTMVPDKKNQSEDDMKMHPVLKYYNVFHIEDTTIESKIKNIEAQEHEPIETAEAIINGYVSREQGLTFQNNTPSDRAFYCPSTDEVVVPMLSQYEVAEEYYSTAFHELVHSTMKKSRCDRESNNKLAAFGSEDYSREELVAELGSAMLCQVAGLDCEKAFRNSVAYIQGWLKALKDDPKAIVWAASRAEKAAIYIQG